jgi:hypothetical protein
MATWNDDFAPFSLVKLPAATASLSLRF